MSRIISLFRHPKQPPPVEEPPAPPLRTEIHDTPLAELPLSLPSYDQLINLAGLEEERSPRTAFYLRQAAANMVRRADVLGVAV